MEYIMLLSKFDKQIAQIVEDVGNGKITYIKVSRPVDEKSGGALSKTVSKIKPEDSTQYIASLSTE